METSSKNLGVIICIYCGCMVDTVDTEKATVLHGVCSPKPCVAMQKGKDGAADEG